MSELDTYGRFIESFASRKGKSKASDEGGADDKANPFNADPATKAKIHHVLRSVHKHVFETAKDNDFESAKARHSACVSLCDPENDEKKDTK